MNEAKYEYHSFENQNTDRVHHERGRYWTRAHRDWRVWVGLIFMLVAMLVYLLTGDLSWRIHLHSQPLGPIAR